MSKFGNAAVVWTDPGTGTERVLLLDAPLRDVRPGFTQTAYTAESLDKTSIQTITVGSGAHELVGTVRYEDNPQGLCDMVVIGATNTTLTYIPDLADPDQSYSVKLIAPRSVEALTVDLDAQRGTGWGEVQVELRFRQTDRTAFTEQYESTPVLFAYQAGNSLADATFARADTATYVSKGYGTVTSAASGKARVHWMDLDSDGVRETPTLLLEGTSTNLIVQSQDLSTTWVNTGTVLTSGQSDPLGTTTAYSVNDDSAVAAENVAITPTFATDAVSKAISVFVKAGTATTTVVNLQDVTAGASRLTVSIAWSNGVPTATASVGTLLATVRHRDGWYRILCRSTAVTVANTNTVFLYPAGTTVADTGTCLFWGVQAENALNPTSYIPTAGGTDARAADTLTFPFVARVQTLTAYIRLIQNGTLPYSASTDQIVGIGTSATETFAQLVNGGGAATVHGRINATQSGVVTPGATHGQAVEIVLWVRVTAATKTATSQVQSAVNGVIGTAGTVSAAVSVADGFTGDVLTLTNSLGVSPTTHVCVMRGVRDMLTMRRIMGVSV